MNTLLHCIRKSTGIITHVIKQNGISLQFARPLMTLKWDLKVTCDKLKKVRPMDPAKSGDGGLNFITKLDEPVPIFAKTEEFKTANDVVKKLCTLEYQPNNVQYYTNRLKAMDLVRRHEFDDESLECNLARRTNMILYLQETYNKNRRNHRLKVKLLVSIDKRNKWLRRLRRWDYKRYEYVLEKLNLRHKRLPEGGFKKPTRNDALRMKADAYKEKVINEKLEAYKKELQEQQVQFFKDKVEKLKFIRSEELDLGLEITVTEEMIEEAQKKAAQYQ